MTLGNTNDNMFDISLIIVLVVLKISIHAHGFTTSTYTPMECLNIDFICLNIDFIGPFPDQGYILDTFTRWVELYHTTDAPALECLPKHFDRFGAPHQLRSDNGPHFIAEVIEIFFFLLMSQTVLH